jgi:ribosomal protein S27AE
MGLYSFYSCPKCGKSLESLMPKGSKGLGEPFRQCPKCRANVIMSQVFNEWQLMTSKERKELKNIIQRQGVFYGGLWGALIGFTGIGYLTNYFEGYGLTLVVLSAVIPGLMGWKLHSTYLKASLRKEIEDSNKRMSRPEYIRKLEELGLYAKWVGSDE